MTRTQSTLRALVASVAGACACTPEPIAAVVVEIARAPAALDFGATSVGAERQLSFRIDNTGNAAYAPEALTVAGPGFRLARTCVLPLAPGASCTETVAFTPAAVGAVAGSVQLPLPDSAGPRPAVEVALSGLGAPALVDVAPRALDFGAVDIGQTRRLDVTLSNQSEGALTVPLHVDVAGFLLDESATATVTIPSHSSVVQAVTFAPGHGGPFAGTLTVETCGAGCGVAVALTGEGLAPRIDAQPRVVDLGTVAAGETASAPLVLQNLGASALHVSAVAVTLEGASTALAAHSLQVTLEDGSPIGVPLVLAPGETHALRVTCTPAHPDVLLAANITVASDDPISPTVLVPIRATVPGAALDVVPAALAFGILAPGQTRTADVVVRSIGTDAATFTRASIHNSAAFATADVGGARALEPGMSFVFSLSATATDAAVLAGEAHGVLVVEATGLPSVDVPLSLFAPAAGCQPRALNPSVNLGNVRLGTVGQGTAFVQNVGTAPCTLSVVRAASAVPFDDDVTYDDGGLLLIPAGGQGTLVFQYAPSTPELASAAVEALFSGVDVPVLLSVTARASDARIVAVPPTLTFGPVPLGCAADVHVASFINVGGEGMQLRGARLAPGSAFFFDPEPRLSQALASGDGVSVLVGATAMPPGHYHDDLTLTYGAGESVQAALDLEVVDSSTITETFAVGSDDADVDILFVIDNSGSMADDQEILATNIDRIFASGLAAARDFHLGIVTTDVDQADAGMLVGGYWTDSTPSFADAFAAAAHVGTDGSPKEQGLEAMRLALDGRNAGFLRPASALSVIVISDEDDSSEAAPESYIDVLKRLRPTPAGEHSRVLFSAVMSAGAARYLRVVDEFGGIRLDINAADWGAALGDIGNATFDADRRFNLANTPEPSSVVVQINGSATTAFHVNGSQVILDAAPSPASTVTVTYIPLCGGT